MWNLISTFFRISFQLCSFIWFSLVHWYVFPTEKRNNWYFRKKNHTCILGTRIDKCCMYRYTPDTFNKSYSFTSIIWQNSIKKVIKMVFNINRNLKTNLFLLSLSMSYWETVEIRSRFGTLLAALLIFLKNRTKQFS